jgi:hypothetical protein
LSTNGKRQQKKELKMPNHVTNQIIVNFNNEEEYDKFKELVEIEFKTAWSPPEPIYFKLRKIFGKDLYINWFCRDEGDNYCGYVHNQQYVNG